MEAILDIKTLIIGNAALTLFAALTLLFYKMNHRTYPGFKLWMTGTFFVSITYILLPFLGLLPRWMIIVPHGLITLAAIMRLDSISRFTQGAKIDRKYYGLPVVYLSVVLYLITVDAQPVVRNFLFGGFTFALIIAALPKFFRGAMENAKLYRAAGLFYGFYGVLFFARGVNWLFHPQVTMLPAGNVNAVYYFMIMIFEMGLAIAVLMINSLHLESDLSNSTKSLYDTVLKLQNAKSEINELTGLLPICSSCKKIRDEDGQWRQIESYISTRSAIEFSHGICPDCVKKLYPDLYPNLFSEDKDS